MNGMRLLSRWVLIAAAGAVALAADLKDTLALLAVSAPAGSTVGIHVVHVESGTPLFSVNEDRLMLSGSNIKLLTGALALERLGPQHTYITRVIREPDGDVAITGSGDPSLSGQVFPYQKNVRPGPALDPIESLAEQIAARGITRIEGDVIGDDRLYPWEPYPPSWTLDDTLHGFGAPVSALSAGDNFVTVTIAPGARVGQPASLSLSPPLEYLTIDNRVLTSARGREPEIHARRVQGTREWALTGSVPIGAKAEETLPVDDPALFAASALYEALTRRGIAITGRPVARHRAPDEPYRPPSGDEIAARVSPPLDQLLQLMEKLSINLHAELLLREVGRATRGTATTAAGLAELSIYLNEIGAAPGDWRLEDGSGLARNDLVTPRLLTLILTHMARSKHGEVWLTLLPAGGQDGTLSERLCCVGDGFGIHAKTGSLSRASALSGYADSRSHGKLAFSILVNNASAPASEVQRWIDKIATALLE
jgi:D-alanyl-D-alanine carboxypeptidase/D-alanyl-D-alanine-endopeptidase (penicillin-binding protein 4)